MPKPINGVQIINNLTFSDQRGWLSELFRADSTPPAILPAMAYISCTKPGISRGPHEHLTQTDTFVFIKGNWWIKLWDNRPESNTYQTQMRFKVSPLTTVIVPPRVVHAYANADALSSGLVLNLPNVLYRGFNKTEDPDEIRHEGSAKFHIGDIENQHWFRRFCKE